MLEFYYTHAKQYKKWSLFLRPLQEDMIKMKKGKIFEEKLDEMNQYVFVAFQDALDNLEWLSLKCKALDIRWRLFVGILIGLAFMFRSAFMPLDMGKVIVYLICLSYLQWLYIPDTISGVLIELFLICNIYSIRVIGPTKAAISPGVTLVAVGPSNGGLRHYSLCITLLASDPEEYVLRGVVYPQDRTERETRAGNGNQKKITIGITTSLYNKECHLPCLH